MSIIIKYKSCSADSSSVISDLQRVKPTGSRNTVSDTDSGKYIHISSELNNAVFWFTAKITDINSNLTLIFSLMHLISKTACRVASDED